MFRALDEKDYSFCLCSRHRYFNRTRRTVKFEEDDKVTFQHFAELRAFLLRVFLFLKCSAYAVVPATRAPIRRTLRPKISPLATLLLPAVTSTTMTSTTFPRISIPVRREEAPPLTGEEGADSPGHHYSNPPPPHPTSTHSATPPAPSAQSLLQELLQQGLAALIASTVSSALTEALKNAQSQAPPASIETTVTASSSNSTSCASAGSSNSSASVRAP